MNKEAQFTVFVLVFSTLKLNWIPLRIGKTEAYFLTVTATWTEGWYEKINKATVCSDFLKIQLLGI